MSSNSAANPAPEPLPAPSYPTVEAFVETGLAEDVPQIFGDVREALGELKGPRADQAKKIHLALDAAVELFQMLFGIRAELEAEARKKGSRR